MSQITRLSAAPWSGYALLFAGMATVGTYVALSRPLVAAFPVFVLATLRFAIAAVVMLPWLRRGPQDAPLSRADRRALWWQSFFGNFLFSICMLHGMSMTTAATAGVILSALPMVVALLSWAVLGERLGAGGIGAVGLAVAAVALLAWQAPAGAGGVVAHASGWGPVLILGCVICEAVYVILGKRIGARVSARRHSALLNGAGGLLMLPLGLWQAGDADLSAVTPGLWALLAFYAVAASVLSTWLWLSGLRRVPAAHSGVFTIALPLASTAVGVAFLGERLTGWYAVSLGLAALGLLLVTRDRQAGASAPESPPKSVA